MLVMCRQCEGSGLCSQYAGRERAAACACDVQADAAVQ